jgi:glycerol-3-phosphate acyltransferase PlsY
MSGMNMLIDLTWRILCAYLGGSFPTAYLAGRFLRGIDIREYGSGNVGATNVFRVLGKGPGMAVLGIDIFKGLLPVVLLGEGFIENSQIWSIVILALAAVAGHNWTVFLRFKGGKGIATSLGVLIGLSIILPSMGLVLGMVLAVWMIVFLASAIVSLASMAAAVCFPVFMLIFPQPIEIFLLGVVFCVFVLLRHRPNFKRLLRGEEPKVRLPFHK